MASIFFIGSESPSSPEKGNIDYSVAYANGKLALDTAKSLARTKYGDKAIVRMMGEDRVGIFVDVAGDLALLSSYYLKSTELIKG